MKMTQKHGSVPRSLTWIYMHCYLYADYEISNKLKYFTIVLRFDDHCKGCAKFGPSVNLVASAFEW